MTSAELEHVGRALASAVEIVMSELESDIERLDPETVLMSEPSDVEAEMIAEDWVDEAMQETVRRQQIVESAMRRRRDSK